MITCDEGIKPADSVSTNVTSIAPTSFYHKNVKNKMDGYILHTVLLMTKLLFIIAIICYHYANHSSKQKKIYYCTNSIKRGQKLI